MAESMKSDSTTFTRTEPYYTVHSSNLYDALFSAAYYGIMVMVFKMKDSDYMCVYGNGAM